MIRWIRRQLDKLETSPGLLKRGHWRVRYSDADEGMEWSNRLTYDVARDYAAMFKGEVHWVRYNDPVYDRQPQTTREKQS